MAWGRRASAAMGLAAMVVAGSLSSVMVPTADAKDSPLFAGRLQDASGTALAGRGVSIYAWPSESATARMAEGTTFRPTLVGRAKTAADGSFVLTPKAGAAAGLADGIHDVTIVSDPVRGRTVSSIDTSVVRERGALKTIAGLGAAGPSAPRSALARSAASEPAASIRAGATPFVTLTAPAAGATAARSAATGAVARAGYCQYGIKTTLVKKYYNRRTDVGGLYSATVGHRSSFSLSNGADAQLGTAMKFGSWKAAGGVSRTLQATTRWGTLTTAGYRVLRTRYTVGKYHVVVGDGVGSCVSYDTMKPISHEGGAESAATKEPTASKCRRYEKGSGITLNKNSATTWASGLDVSGLIGFDVSAKSGYSSSEKVDVRITASGGRKICGSTAFPAQGPTLVVVKP